MLSLPRYIVLLVLWISLFFNIERLHVNKDTLVNIAGPIYVLTTVLLVVSLLLPLWRRIPVTALLSGAFLSFVVIKLLYNRPYWGDVYTYLTLLELTAVLVTVGLAHRVGQGMADFVETVRGLLLSDLDGRVHTPDQAESIVRREMRSARRRNHPMSLLLIQADVTGGKVDLNATEREIERLLTHRVGSVTLTRLLAQNLRPTDSIVHETQDGRWLLMTSEVERGQASAILQRLNDETQKRLGIRLNFGMASFPDQGITFEDLIGQAEKELNADFAKRRDSTSPSLPLVPEEANLELVRSDPARMHDDA